MSDVYKAARLPKHKRVPAGHSDRLAQGPEGETLRSVCVINIGWVCTVVEDSDVNPPSHSAATEE